MLAFVERKVSPKGRRADAEAVLGKPAKTPGDLGDLTAILLVWRLARA